MKANTLKHANSIFIMGRFKFGLRLDACFSLTTEIKQSERLAPSFLQTKIRTGLKLKVINRMDNNNNNYKNHHITIFVIGKSVTQKH